jgi:16S rRNA (cytidine1402-2'-O)-methyltransferase
VPLLSLPSFAERSRAGALLDRIEKGAVLGFATDAGSVGISDPGQHLVGLAIERGLPVEALPGPSALVMALQLSGFAYDRFFFLGFLPRRGRGRREAMAQVIEAARLGAALVFFESPHRLRETLADLREALGDRRAVVARELTKLHEEVARGSLGNLAERFAGTIRGEVTLVVEGGAAASSPQVMAAEDVDAEIHALLREGLHTREAAGRIAARHGLSSREAYKRVLAVAARPIPG